MNRSPNKEVGRGRFLGIVIAFVVICVAHVIVLAVFQINGMKNRVEDDSVSERTVSVAGLRGEIYDRNGKLLVGNATSYDVVYEYGAMPYTYKEINGELLGILEALESTGNGDKISEDLFVFEGTYPHMRYRSEVYDPDSDYGYHFLRTLDRMGLEKDISEEELLEYIMKKYKIDDELYSDSEVTALVRLWYEMNRVDFGYYASYTIAEGCDYSFCTYMKEMGVEGATFMAVTERVYYYPGIASHILGTVGKITEGDAEYYSALGYPMDAVVGRSGCELAFEEWLRGIDGKMVIKYDENGNITEKYYEVEPVGGNDVWLTIDIDLQIAAEEGLRDNVEAVKTANAGALTAVDPDTGEILAIASYPTYDLTRYSELEYYSSLSGDENKPLLNRALNEIYAPGSVYKVGMALAALEEGGITQSTRYTCNKVYPHLHRPTCLGTHGSIDVVEAIKESCNVFFYTIGHNMGIDRITPYTSSLGLGKSTGIELGEKTGNIAGSAYRESVGGKEWSSGDDLSAAIGQSDHGYTPLQLSVYMSSIVNGGDRYEAHLLGSVREFYTEELIYEYSPSVVESVDMSGNTHSVLIESMGKVVEGSSSLSWNFRNVGAKVGGKTGTAQRGGELSDNALFSGFAPLDDPEIVVSCVIEGGAAGYNASIAASRVFTEYFDEDTEEYEKGE